VATIAIAMLLSIHVGANSVTFTFTAPPATVQASYTTKPLVQCASGLPVVVRGVHFVIRFRPARTALSFAKQRRLKGTGAVRELAKTCDFEADLAWAVGVDKRRPYNVTRKGARVTVVFG